MTTVVFDSEPVAALLDVRSSKHREVLSYLEADRGRRRRRPGGATFLVPSTVRVEAGWDRRRPAAALANRLPIADHHLDERTADIAAERRHTHGVAIADAHIGSIIESMAAHDVVVLTSDPADIAAVAAGLPVRIIRV
jgi:hypothetical protein